MQQSRRFWANLIPSCLLILVIGVLASLSFQESWTWLLIAVVVLASVGHAAWISRQIASEREALMAMMNRLRDGHFAEAVELRGRSDLDPLVVALNEMRAAVADRLHESERRTSELRQAEQLLQAVLGTMADGTIVIDSEQRILFANDVARSLLDFVTRDVHGRHLWEVVRSPQIQELVRPVLSTGRQGQTEFPLLRTRSMLTVTATSLPIDPLPGAVLLLQNVTEIRRLEKLRQDFVSNVSHELKTPLTAIQAYAETLLDGAINDSQHNRNFLERIIEQSDRLHHLILDLLRLTKIESQQDAFEIRPVDLIESVEECLDAHIAVARAKDIELLSELADERIGVLADPEELRTIADNLVTNALNYTSAGGRVIVRCSRDKEFALLQVQDTGVGITREQQARIFERFYRADRARHRSQGGTGLGLAIVKHLVQLFGGSVDVVSERGRGSTFTVSLPAVEADSLMPPEIRTPT